MQWHAADAMPPPSARGPFQFHQPEVAEGPGRLGRAQVMGSVLTLLLVLGAIGVGGAYAVSGVVAMTHAPDAARTAAGAAMCAGLPVALALPVVALVAIRRGGRRRLMRALAIDLAAVVLLAALAWSLPHVLQALTAAPA